MQAHGDVIGLHALQVAGRFKMLMPGCIVVPLSQHVEGAAMHWAHVQANYAKNDHLAQSWSNEEGCVQFW